MLQRSAVIKNRIGWLSGILLISATIFIILVFFFSGLFNKETSPLFSGFFPLYVEIIWTVLIFAPMIAGIGMLLGFVWWPKHKEKVNAYLRQNGVKTKTQLLTIEMDFRLAIQAVHPYFIQSEGINPITKQKEIFRSDHIWFNPQGKVPGELIVYVDPKKGHPCYMDISFLENIPENSQL